MRTEVNRRVPEKHRSRKEDHEEEGGTRRRELEKEKCIKGEKGKPVKTGL